jgi:hypothetical protein
MNPRKAIELIVTKTSPDIITFALRMLQRAAN